jgi:putative Holliday junction resolvase
MSRILGIDPGDVRIGLALSDSSQTIASPFTVLKHVSRANDAARIVEIANQNEVGLIVIGQSIDDEGQPSFQGRKAARLGEAIQAITNLPVEFWDESFSTQMAHQSRLARSVKRKKNTGHIDDAAAAILLQTYLDTKDHFLDRIVENL